MLTKGIYINFDIVATIIYRYLVLHNRFEQKKIPVWMKKSQKCKSGATDQENKYAKVFPLVSIRMTQRGKVHYIQNILTVNNRTCQKGTKWS